MINFVGVEAYLSAFTYLVTVLVPVTMIAWKTERRSKFILRAVLSVLVMLALIELFTFVTQYIFENKPQWYPAIIFIQLIKFLLIFVLSGIAVLVCFKCDKWGALFCATAGYCVQHISARTDSVIKDFLLPELHWAVSMVIGIIIAAAVFALFWFIVPRRLNRDLLTNIANKWQVAIASCVVGINIFYNSFGISYLTGMELTMTEAGLDTSPINKLMLFVYIMSAVVALLALILDFGISDNKRLSGEMQELERIMDESKRQYEYEKNNIEMINLKCHDLKHQLAAMKGKIYEEQIEELHNVVEIYDSSLKTGNEALDVVLTQKNFYCGRNGIRLTCLINGENYNFIARHELYTLFNNALDNAIEAVEKLPEEKRIISVTEQTAQGFVSVRFENYYNGVAHYKDGLPVSQKGGEGHGYGVKSIKMIAEKYGGGICVTTKDDTFTLDIFFRK